MKLQTIAHDKKELEVNETIFGASVNQPLLGQAVRVYQSNARQGTSKTKTRSEINRTHKKWYKQKGTGNARHGARNANIFVGGGISHGPTGEQNYSLKLTTKMKQKALLSALSWQAPSTMICDAVEKLDGKTKSAATLLQTHLQDDQRILLVVDRVTPLIRQSVNNIPTILTVSACRLNTLQVLSADKIIFTGAALVALEDRLIVKEA